ncbi:DUF7576 family protein [Haladaptatus sp. NG-SE-30]
MSGTAHPDEEFRHCANCNKLVDLVDHHPTVVVEHASLSDETERVTLHFCSGDCLHEWTGPFPE